MEYFDIKNHYKFVPLLFGMLTCLLANAQEISVRAEVSPSVVMVGERAEYTLRFINTTQIPNMGTPRVDGLAFSSGMSTSSFRQIINGAVTVETRGSWSFTATRTGTFIIPGRTTRISGQTVEIQPVTFEVVPMDEATRSRAFLQLELPDGPYYVGQALTAKLGLFVRDDLTLSNIAFPEREGEGFLNTEFDDNPNRTRTRVSGRIYEAFVWEFILTPIKSGPTSLRFIQNIAIQESSSDNRFPRFFNLDRTQTKPLALFTDTLEVDVLPLPEDNRPASFSDAVGEFNLTATLSTRELVVGEPITLTLTLSGTGNFDRIAPPRIPEWENWRLYPPKVEFKPGGDLGISGSKSFEYILIPQSETIEEVPSLEYAYFNPENSDYTTVQIDAQPVTVAPSSKPVDSGVFLGSDFNEQEEEERIPEALLPIRPETGALIQTGPPWENYRFWMVNGSFAIILLGVALVLHRKRRLRDDNQLARRHAGSRKVRKSLQRAGKAASSEDAEAFFIEARSAIQERVSHLSKTPLEAKTLVTSDCLDILKDSDLPDSVVQKCSQILHAADASQFAGSPASTKNLLSHADELRELISDLNRFQK
ncbi:protein BatD [Puniceicoccales bacterium CK1056]|uniref:Protein BatD n=1 Tax=Oceanipulchritudo coccoides TaxID=2706888 RepID=A0A6B2LZ29_9BACT|nr:BatD family protein [Oceanipulchritudo coccoides]NDV61299.1 protein BatD [Oceanipulchritudo coccoides]